MLLLVVQVEMGVMRKVSFFYCLFLLGYATSASACPDGQSSGLFGWCYPNVGGEVGKAWEKGKQELANFERDARTWLETGKCGGDICDAFAAAIEFGVAQIKDTGRSLEAAGKRLQEGKPIDAVWHLQTDYFKNAEENAYDAAKRSRVLLATGQVAASVYGGPGGAAAYTAWLAYKSSGNLDDAIKAGLISGISSAALGEISDINLDGTEGVVARSVLTGAVNGAAVAAAGGDDAAIRAAVGMGVVTVMVREGYKKLTDLELDEHRLRSSTGEAYCLAEVPTPEYVQGNVTSSCFAPPTAYKLTQNREVALNRNGNPLVDFKQLDPDRPHVGVWAKADTGAFNLKAENSGFMTTLSRLPGWNAMAVGHDELSAQMNFDLLPGGIGMVPTVVTIPPAVVATYLGTGYQIHDTIRDTFKKREQDRLGGNRAREGGMQTSGKMTETFPVGDPLPSESFHLICGVEKSNSGELSRRTDILVQVVADGIARGKYGRLCEVTQRSKGKYFKLGHAHNEINYCHKVAERIARGRQKSGESCFASTSISLAGSNPQTR